MSIENSVSKIISDYLGENEISSNLEKALKEKVQGTAKSASQNSDKNASKSTEDNYKSETAKDNVQNDSATRAAEATALAYSKIIKAALGTSAENQTSSLVNMLSTLLRGTSDENDDNNADLIASLINLITKYKSRNSTVEFEV